MTSSGQAHLPGGASGSDASGLGWPDLPKRMARRLAVRLPLERMNFEASMELERLMATDGGATAQPIGIACSGGADSLGLLLLVWAHFPALRKRMVILHFDHRIRGGESAADARFVQTVADVLDLRCEQGAWAEGSADASEDAARDARMEFLHAKAQIICFGHNRTDVAETILLRLGRGSSLDGLAGPRPVQTFRNKPGVVHLRPLLDLSGEEIRAALRECALSWREDSTNAGTKYARNKLRHEVLPLLEAALGRDWAAGAARSRIRIEEADAMLDALAGRQLETLSDKNALPLETLHAVPSAVARRVLERWLADLGLRERVGAQAIDGILAIASGVLPAGDAQDLRPLGLEISGGILRTCARKPEPRSPEWSEIGVATDCEVFFPGRARLKIQTVAFAEGQVADAIAALRSAGSTTDVMLALPPGAVLDIRRRMPGDAYRPLGAPGRTTLQNLFVNRKVPVSERSCLPVVLENGRPAWAPFLPPAEECRLTADSRIAVRLTYGNNSPASGSY